MSQISDNPINNLGDPSQNRLRLLSYNIQAGIATTRLRDYFTHSWRHVLPCSRRLGNLNRIALQLEKFDIVGLQEADGGSIRSGFVNLTEYVALRARFPWWYDQTNRDLGKLAQNSLGILSRFVPTDVSELRLPGMIPGRGALLVRYGIGDDALVVIIAHLALGRRARLRQFGYLAQVIRDAPHVVLMGDFNCESDSVEMNWMLANTNLREPVHGFSTFPSWRPQWHIDHILVSKSISVRDVKVLNLPISDHLPIAMEVELPHSLQLRRPLGLPLHAVNG